MVDNQPHQHDPQPMEAVTGIPRVRLLLGHVNPDTAYVVDDYPYGYRLRCRIRYWIEEDTRRGSHAGWQRFVSQTTNPRRPGQPWNQPKESTYARRMWMYLDEDNHVQHTGIGQYGIDPHQDARLRLAGIYDQLPAADRQVYEQVLAASRQFPDPWAKWEDTIEFLTAHLREHRDEPPRCDNGFVTRDGQPYYIGETPYPTAVAVARLRQAGLTLPGTTPTAGHRDVR